MNEFRLFAGQDGDAQIALGIALVGVVLWGISLGANIGWLLRANGSRPFVRAVVAGNVIFLALAVSFAVNSAYIQSVSNDDLLRASFYANRALVAIAAIVLWQLRRDIDQRANH